MSNVKEFLAASASLCTLLQFLSGSLTCLHYVKKKNVGENSHIPFIAGFLNCSMWLSYGMVAQESTILTVNLIGLILFFLYVIIHYLYSLQRVLIVRDFLICLVLIGIINVYIMLGIEQQVLQFQIGNLASFITVLFFAAPLVNVVKVIQSRNSSSMPIPFISMTLIACSFWFLYGVSTQNIYVQLPNAVGFVLSLFQLSLCAMFKPKNIVPLNRLKETL